MPLAPDHDAANESNLQVSRFSEPLPEQRRHKGISIFPPEIEPCRLHAHRHSILQIANWKLVSVSFSGLIMSEILMLLLKRSVLLLENLQQGVVGLFEDDLQLPEQAALPWYYCLKITLESFSLCCDSGKRGFRLVDCIRKYF